MYGRHQMVEIPQSYVPSGDQIKTFPTSIQIQQRKSPARRLNSTTIKDIVHQRKKKTIRDKKGGKHS